MSSWLSQNYCCLMCEEHSRYLLIFIHIKKLHTPSSSNLEEEYYLRSSYKEEKKEFKKIFQKEEAKIKKFKKIF